MGFFLEVVNFKQNVRNVKLRCAEDISTYRDAIVFLIHAVYSIM